MFRFLIVIALAAGGALAPALARHKAASPADVTHAIEALVQKQSSLLMKRDAAGLAGLFTADAVYATATGEVFSGRDKIRGYYARTIPALGDAFSRESSADEVHVLGDHAWALGHGKTVVKTREGVAELKDHWLAIYEAVGGEWKVRSLNLGENVTLLPASF